MAEPADRDVPGSGSGWDEIQYGGMTRREAFDMSNSFAPHSNTGSVSQPGSVGSADPSQGPMPLYRYCTLGAGAFLFFHFGLQKTALTSFSGFIEAAVVIGGTIWVNTKKGIAVTQALLYFLLVGLVLLAFWTTLSHELGLNKNAPNPAKAVPVKHHMGSNSG